MTPRLRRIVSFVLITALLLGVVIVRVLVEGGRELAIAREARRAGDVPTAVRHYRRAAHWYLPGSSSCAHAYEELESIATEAEAQGRTEHALEAWRAIRASALATEWLIVPQATRLERANTHIAALMAELPPPPQDEGKSRAQLREEHLSLLNEHHAPEPAWIVVMGLGFALWLSSLFWGARNGWTEENRPRWASLGIAFGCFVLGLSILLLGVARA